MRDMKRTFLFISAIVFMSIAVVLIGCQANSKEIVVTVDEKGNADGGHIFERINKTDFYIDNIKYSARNGDLVVTGYNQAFFKGAANIISKLKYNNQIMNVVGIDGYAFSFCSSLTSVTIPNSITDLGSCAFFGCSRLTSVTIPNSVTILGDTPFQCCNGLTSIIVGRGNTVYDSRDNCNAIIETKTNSLITGCKNSTIPNSVTSIGPCAFQWCGGLTSVTIPSSVTKIDERAFASCDSLTSVTIPSSVTSIDESAFQGCDGLTSVTIPSGVTSIGPCAFADCDGLTSVTIPSNVTSIDDGAFHNCPALTQVKLNSNAIVSKNRDSKSSMHTIFGDQVQSYVIGGNVTSIGKYAFYECKNLASVTISKGVTSIGEHAFNHCTGLTSITIPNGVKSIGDGAFSRCYGLTSITIPNSVTSIGSYIFWQCSSLTDVYCYAKNVPTAEHTSFLLKPFYSNPATLHVPAASLGKYKATNSWSEFRSIVAIK